VLTRVRYPFCLSQRFDESSPNGADYLAEVCREWEAAAAPAAELGTRLVVLRLGIVLDKGGGALASMAPAFQAFAGGPLGDGRQWLSWIHREDAVAIICACLRCGHRSLLTR
jgi:NAD dependent epimerase/dehydratase family enzyme